MGRVYGRHACTSLGAVWDGRSSAGDIALDRRVGLPMLLSVGMLILAGTSSMLSVGELVAGCFTLVEVDLGTCSKKSTCHPASSSVCGPYALVSRLFSLEPGQPSMSSHVGHLLLVRFYLHKTVRLFDKTTSRSAVVSALQPSMVGSSHEPDSTTAPSTSLRVQAASKHGVPAWSLHWLAAHKHSRIFLSTVFHACHATNCHLTLIFARFHTNCAPFPFRA